MRARNLPDLLDASASRYPDKVAIVDAAGQEATYADVARQADALARFLAASGVTPGDRVGVVLPKGIAAIVSFFGIMKAGAAYVPIELNGPAERGRQILIDCGVRAVVADPRALQFVSDVGAIPIVVSDEAGGNSHFPTIAFEAALKQGGPDLAVCPTPSDIAYILHTSGSTGTPKGVMISHGNVLSFLDWCSATLEPSPDDRFSSHPPFHFDPSVFDIYLALKHGASLHLISDALGKSPEELARFIETRRLTVWCSASSVLMLLTQYGNLQHHDASSLRIVLFGGEVFPVKPLGELQERWPFPVYYNAYGPTETCVFCTLFRIPPAVQPDREVPYPIGFPGPHCQVLVLNDRGEQASGNEEGLLHVTGAPVFAGYWNRPIETEAAFITRNGLRWYNTGDIVRWDPTDGLVYVGRKDGMIKRRGFRIELGEIEHALYLHPRVREAAVVSDSDAGQGGRIVAFVSCDGLGAPSIIDFKTFCATRLPLYMIPDQFVFRRELPRTSNDKVDYQGLRQELAAAKAG